MVVKDRLSELQSKSKYLTDNSMRETISIEASDDKKLSLDTAEKIILNLRDIRKNVGDMETLENQILMEPSKTGREKLLAEHNDLVESTSKLATEIQGLVKAELEAVDLLTSKPSLTLDQFQELRVRTGIFTRSPDTQLESSRSGEGKVNHKYKSVWLSHEYPWVRQTLVSSLARCFQEAWAEFSRVQVQFRQQNKEALLRKVRITEKELSQEAVERKVASGDLAIFSQEDNSQAEAARLQLVAIEDRHRDILQLEAAVMELHGMFSDAYNMVSMQGEVLARIEAAVEVTAVKVEEGAGDLHKAETYQAGARRKKILLAIIGIVVLIILVLVIAYVFKSSPVQIQ